MLGDILTDRHELDHYQLRNNENLRIPLHSTTHSQLFIDYRAIIIIIIIIIIKKDWQCKAGRGRLIPYQSEDPSPTLPAYRGKEDKGKIVEDKKGESK